MFQSALFQGDALLEAIALDDPPNQVRISQSQNRLDPAVTKIQTALLTWRPGCLPEHGADGEFGSESATAIHTFKVEELGVPEAEVIDDVGPRSVVRLDEIQAAAETPPASEPGAVGDFVVVMAEGAAAEQFAAARAAVEIAGGQVPFGLAERALVAAGGAPALAALQALAAVPESGIVLIVEPGAAPDPSLDEETAGLIESWQATFDPEFAALVRSDEREGTPWDLLGECTEEVPA